MPSKSLMSLKWVSPRGLPSCLALLCKKEAESREKPYGAKGEAAAQPGPQHPRVAVLQWFLSRGGECTENTSDSAELCRQGDEEKCTEHSKDFVTVARMAPREWKHKYLMNGPSAQEILPPWLRGFYFEHKIISRGPFSGRSWHTSPQMQWQMSPKRFSYSCHQQEDITAGVASDQREQQPGLPSARMSWPCVWSESGEDVNWAGAQVA